MSAKPKDFANSVVNYIPKIKPQTQDLKIGFNALNGSKRQTRLFGKFFLRTIQIGSQLFQSFSKFHCANMIQVIE